MDLTFSEEQRLLKESTAGFLARHYSFEARRAVLADGGWSTTMWDAFANELGLLAITASEEAGGFGGGPVEAMIVLEEIGRALVLEPYLECVVLGAALLRHGGGAMAEQLACGIVDGTVRPVAALAEDGARYDTGTVATRAISVEGGWSISGAKIVVPAAPAATHFLVSARTSHDVRARNGISLFAIPADSVGLARLDYALIDGRRAADIRFDNLLVPGDALIGAVDEAWEVIDRALDEATAALCGEAVGVMRWMLEATVDYARQREQFGKPIGSFQVLQHRMVDMHVKTESNSSIAIMAALSLDLPAIERRKAVSAAKVFMGEAVKFVAQSAVQIHGGIGTTDELAISHYFKRATVMESQFGDTAFHLRRMVEATDMMSDVSASTLQ